MDLWIYKVKAIGGSWVKKTCQAYLNAKIQLRSQDMTNSISRGLDFYIENKRVNFGDFVTIFAYKIFNIDVESTKIVSKMEIMDRITKRILKIKFFENFGHDPILIKTILLLLLKKLLGYSIIFSALWGVF